MTTSEAFTFLNSILWEYNENDDENLIDLINISKKYQQFDLCSNCSESFDGESLFLIENDQVERFIWKRFDSEKIKEINLELGTYEKVVKSFVNWFYSTISDRVG